MVLLLGYYFGWIGLQHLPGRIGGIIPLAIPWFGAIGAVTSSLYGVFDHNASSERTDSSGTKTPVRGWDNSYDYWHVLRPAVGAIFATVAYLIFIGFINATQGSKSPSSPSPIPGSPEATIPYLVIAFVVGYRESTFRQLLTRVIDMILGPGIPGVTPPAGIEVTPAELDFGDQTEQGKASAPKSIQVTNTGSGMLAIYEDGGDHPGISIEGDDRAAFNAAPNTLQGAVLAPGTQAVLPVIFTPPAAQTYTATLTVRCNAGQRSVSLKGGGPPPPPPVDPPVDPPPVDPPVDPPPVDPPPVEPPVDPHSG